MSDAIIVQEAYKQFGKQAALRWQRLCRGKSGNGNSPEDVLLELTGKQLIKEDEEDG